MVPNDDSEIANDEHENDLSGPTKKSEGNLPIIMAAETGNKNNDEHKIYEKMDFIFQG